MYKKKYIVYLIANYYNNKTYLGITDNLEKKIIEHNTPKINKVPYTKKYKENGIWVCCLKISNLLKYEAYTIERMAKNKRLGDKNLNFIQKRLNSILDIIKKYTDAKTEVFIK